MSNCFESLHVEMQIEVTSDNWNFWEYLQSFKREGLNSVIDKKY